MIRLAGLVLVLVLVTEPQFFTLYRLAAFSTVPHDDYAPYLQWLLGQGGFLPGSPYGYRLLSVAAAIPFDLLPPIRLSNLPAGLDPSWLRATGALAMLSHVSSVASAVAAFALARRHGLPRGDAALAGFLLWLFCWFTQVTAIDSFAVLLIALGLLVLHRRVLFALLMLLAVGANEKVLIVFALWLGLRCLLCADDRRALAVPLLCAVLGCLLYGAVLLGVHLPANDYQLQPSRYLTIVLGNLRATLSGRGALLNVLPTLLLAGVAMASWQGLAGRLGPFRPLDVLVVPALVAVALVMTLDFQVGRIVMHAAPLFVVPAAAAFGRVDAAVAKR